MNKQSVSRAETIRAFLPIYERYCTEVTIPPFVPKSLIPSILVESDGNKHISKENLPNRFNVKLNNIWSDTILTNYSAKSIYDWQIQWFEIRNLSYKYASYITRILENALEKNYDKANSLVKDANDVRKKWGKITVKDFPAKSVFIDDIRKINDWKESYQNFLTQSTAIINNENADSQRLAKMNLDNSLCRLYQMQNSFDFIFNETYRYEEISDKKTITEIESKEKLWYERLQRVIYFWEYFESSSKKIFIVNAKSEILEWWDNINVQRLTNVKEIITQFEEDSYYIFYISDELNVEEYDVRKISIAIEVSEFGNLEEITNDLLEGLYPLGNLDISYYTFILIDTFDVYPIGIQIPKESFERVEKYITTGEFEDFDFGKPLPIFLTEKDIEFLSNAKLKKFQPPKENDVAFVVLNNLWQFDEYRKYTNDNVSIEREWLKKKKDSIQKTNQANIKKLENIYSFERLEELKKLNNEVLELNNSFKMDKVCFILGVPENAFS